MQADARFIEDVEHADQAAADLACQADPLGLAAGQRRRRALECQIVEADVEEKTKPAADLLEDLIRDGPLDRLQAVLERPGVWIEPRRQIPHRCGTHFNQRPAADPDGPCLRIEALSLASRAAHDAHILFQLQAPRTGGRLLEAAQELRDDSFPLAAVFPDSAAAHLPFIGDVSLAGAVEQEIALL